jgi:predicted nucleotidyltransferase
MAKKRQAGEADRPRRLYLGADIPMRVIRRYARQVAGRFRPQQIILFGSHAYGTPHEDSDVDLLVVMRARNVIDQAVRIRLALPAPFPMDLLVRTPTDLRSRLLAGDSFLREIVARGKVLYGQTDRPMDRQGRSRLPRDAPTAQGEAAPA